MWEQKNLTGCIICGADLEYLDTAAEMTCSVCGKTFQSNVRCKNGHYVCDECHEAGAVDYIYNYCLNTVETDPLVILLDIMKNPKIHMHGPEHHFMVPAVLLAAYYNIQGQHDQLGAKLKIAKDRSSTIPGGFCGFYGACGAGIGTGIFISIISGSTPVSVKEWRLSNLMTSKSLEVIANNGGPRCCKRDSYAAIETAVDFVKDNFGVEIPITKIECQFSPMNRECKKAECRYYKEEAINAQQQ